MSQFRIAAALAGALFILLPVNAGAVSPAELSRADGLSAVVFVQDKQKPETVKHAVKRIWRNLTGYKFDVACPAFAFAITRESCLITGKSRDDARAECRSRHALCEVRDAK